MNAVSVPLACCVVLLGCGTPPAAAQDSASADFRVEYQIRLVPGDPASPVTFQVALSLLREQGAGDVAGWRIATIEFRRPGYGGTADTVWSTNDPDVITADGLWWVTHDDPAVPSRADFVLPPRLLGSAEAAVSSEANLDFDFEGRVYTAPREGAPYEVTAALRYEFRQDGIAIIPPEHEDEPVEVPLGELPSDGDT